MSSSQLLPPPDEQSERTQLEIDSQEEAKVTGDEEGEKKSKQDEDGNARRVPDDDDDDGYHTPTSPRYRIPPALVCPPAPRKPVVLPRKRTAVGRCLHIAFPQLQPPEAHLAGDITHRSKKGRAEDDRVE